MGKYFGTDGIRGVANVELDTRLAYKAGFAAAYVVGAEKERPHFLIAKDTRISGDMLECAVAAGLMACGADVSMLGVLPTPALALLVKNYGCDAGIMISASHNPFEHNGIKIFGETGYKLSDEQEGAIEKLIDDMPEDLKKQSVAIGRVVALDKNPAEDYVNHVVNSAPSRLDGLRVLVDCANGASYKTAGPIFERLGASADIINNAPDGVNINVNCGSTHIERLAETVKNGPYDAGAAFDGDADRFLACDEDGGIIDGDRIIAILARDMKERGVLKGGAAATIVSNLGLKMFLKEQGIGMAETAVGDRAVLESMLELSYNLGGEQSGHVILSDHGTTGDGQLTAAFFLGVLKRSGGKASALKDIVRMFPQVTLNVQVPNDKKSGVMQSKRVNEAIEKAEECLGENGRVIVRPSGTEAFVRVMVEGQNDEEIKEMAKAIRDAISREIKL